MRPRFLALALVAAAATTAPAHGATKACGQATARAAITATKLRIKMLGPDSTPVNPRLVDQVICFDFTRDGRIDVAASIASGGTAGNIGFVVFRRTAGGWVPALKGGGYKLGIRRLGGDVVLTQPVFRKNDANCCPSGGFNHDRYHWNGARFTIARSWHTKTFRP
jgi:hypothetical protein